MLYVVATPIGNMGDITLRALETLKSVDLIAAEDTRQTAKLLSHYDIQKPLISYYEHNKMSRGPQLVEKLKSGENIALVSDAGTPGISDPGEDLIRLCISENIEVTMLPGPVAGITALVLSGLPTGKFVFEGFLPEDKKKRKQRIDAISGETRTVILYESPYNLIRTLSDIEKFAPERTVVLCRELTKKFEEKRRGKASEHLSYFENGNSPRGEYVIVLEGTSESENDIAGSPDLSCVSDSEIYDLVEAMMGEGDSKNSAVKKAALKLGVSKNNAYAAYERVHRGQQV